MLTHQIIYFKNGAVKSIFNIDGVRSCEMLHLHITDGRTYLINKEEVNCIEVVPEGMGKEVWGEEFGVLHTNNRKK